MPLAVAVLLGIVQGLTEFLPVSSSAHLILARAFFGWEVPADAALAFDVAVHVGTLAAIILFFRRELTSMFLSLPGALSAAPDAHGRLVQLIVVGTLPVVVVGLLFADVIEERLRRPVVSVAALTIGAVALLIAERLGPRTRTEASLGWLDAVLIGCAQASALIPGMSRSGSTIAMGMFLGMRREAAARFTFLLAIPAMIAAAAKESLEFMKADAPALDLQMFAVGMVTSAIVGYLTIKYFLRFLAGHRLDVFAYYRFVLAAVTLFWVLR